MEAPNVFEEMLDKIGAMNNEELEELSYKIEEERKREEEKEFA